MENLYCVYGIVKKDKLKSRIIRAKNQFAAADKFSKKYKTDRIVSIDIVPISGAFDMIDEPVLNYKSL